MRNQANIQVTLAVGSSVTNPYYDVNITQKLCSAACADETPVFNPSFSVKSVENVGTNQYLAYVHIEGTITYMPCGCGCCATRSQMISQDFSLPIFSSTAITGITITTGATANTIVKEPCKNCSRIFSSSTPVTVNIA